MMTFALIFQQAQQPTAGAGSFLVSMMPILLIFAVFYFLILAPQRKRQRALQEMVSELKAGDRIVTNGGIIATVTAVRDTSLLIRSADKSILEISRSAVAGMHTEEKKGS
ncbi:MAG: preprotein translocase subunit YajC [Acidobacteriota bacterium]|nr:preprotein translocase subunit YajC [Acidobacteriota bacterium]